jgi:hypothetical protein
MFIRLVHIFLLDSAPKKSKNSKKLQAYIFHEISIYHFSEVVLILSKMAVTTYHLKYPFDVLAKIKCGFANLQPEKSSDSTGNRKNI